MPVHPGHDQVAQDPIRLANLIGVAAENVGHSLAPLRELAEDAAFWRLPGRGLAAFADRKLVRIFRTPRPLPERVQIGNRFAIKAVLQTLESPTYFVLAASQQRVRLLRGDRLGLDELEAPQLPSAGLADVPGASREHNRLQAHGRGHDGSQDAAYHGHRDDTKGDDESTARLCRACADALSHEREAAGVDHPVVIVAVQRLAHDLERLGNLSGVVAHVASNPDALSARELATLTWPHVESWLKKRQEAQAARVLELRANGLGDQNLERIVTAANDGRIDTLFVDLQQERWGQFDAGDRSVVVHDTRHASDEDLIDLAASLTLAAGGSIVPRLPAPLPQHRPAAAIYRHALS